MKLLWAAALIICLGGCLAPPAVEQAPAPAAGLAAGETADLSTPARPAQVFVPFHSAAPVRLPTEEITQFDLDADLDAAADDPIDPDLMEDARLLAGEDESPPEEEGLTESPVEGVTFDVPVVVNDKVRYYIDNFSGPNQKVFRRWLERSGRYLPMMRGILAEEGLPQDLVYLAMIESGFNDRAYSWAHAAGPWQFIEGTGRLYGLDLDWWRDERRDPVKATKAAARHLKDLQAQFEGDWYLAMAAYNAGGGKIRRAIEMYGTRDFWQLSHGSYLQPETKNYVPKFLAALLIAKEPEKYGFTDLAYQDPLDFETVKLPSTTDLEIVADLCRVGYEEIKDLNPELKRWCTPPGERDYEVRIPAGSGKDFFTKYRLIPEDRRANYQRHKIKPGDTLSALAKKYKIRVEDIVSMNRIRNPRALRVGVDLILPMKKGSSSRPLAELGNDPQPTRRSNYTVRKGDSLWKIARQFGVSEKDLRNWNRLGKSSTLRPGQTLVVTAGGGRPAASKTAAGKQTGTRKVVYQVRQGDTLWGIGRRFEVAARQIRDWNNLTDDHVLRPGDRLTLLVRDDQKG